RRRFRHDECGLTLWADPVRRIADRALERDEPAVGLVEVLLFDHLRPKPDRVADLHRQLEFQRSPPNASVAYGAVARLKSPDWIARHRRPCAIRSPKIVVFMNSASVCRTL